MYGVFQSKNGFGLSDDVCSEFCARGHGGWRLVNRSRNGNSKAVMIYGTADGEMYANKLYPVTTFFFSFFWLYKSILSSNGKSAVEICVRVLSQTHADKPRCRNTTQFPCKPVDPITRFGNLFFWEP